MNNDIDEIVDEDMTELNFKKLEEAINFFDMHGLTSEHVAKSFYFNTQKKGFPNINDFKKAVLKLGLKYHE